MAISSPEKPSRTASDGGTSLLPRRESVHLELGAGRVTGGVVDAGHDVALRDRRKVIPCDDEPARSIMSDLG